MEASVCCDTTRARDHDACPNKQVLAGVAGMSIHNVSDCHINAVLLGFAVVQASAEKDTKVQKSEVLHLPTSVFVDQKGE